MGNIIEMSMGGDTLILIEILEILCRYKIYSETIAYGLNIIDICSWAARERKQLVDICLSWAVRVVGEKHSKALWKSVEHFRNEFQEKELTHLGELCYFATPQFVLNYC